MRAAQCIVLNEHTDEDGGIVIRHACKLGLEGIVSKRLSKPYQSGRSGHWLKVTVRHAEREFMEHLSVGPDVGRADHLGPLLGFIGDELPEVGGRTRKYRGPSGFLQCTVFPHPDRSGSRAAAWGQRSGGRSDPRQRPAPSPAGSPAASRVRLVCASPCFL